jgi:hypothetical protein
MPVGAAPCQLATCRGAPSRASWHGIAGRVFRPVRERSLAYGISVIACPPDARPRRRVEGRGSGEGEGAGRATMRVGSPRTYGPPGDPPDREHRRRPPRGPDPSRGPFRRVPTPTPLPRTPGGRGGCASLAGARQAGHPVGPGKAPGSPQGRSPYAPPGLSPGPDDDAPAQTGAPGDLPVTGPCHAGRVRDIGGGLGDARWPFLFLCGIVPYNALGFIGEGPRRCR